MEKSFAQYVLREEVHGGCTSVISGLERGEAVADALAMFVGGVGRETMERQFDISTNAFHLDRLSSLPTSVQWE
jgi:hypothetical protein